MYNSMIELLKVEEDVLEAILQKFIPNDENFVSVTYDIFPPYTVNNLEQYLRDLQYKSMIASYVQTLSDVDINLTPEGIAYFRNKKKAIFPKNSKELLKQLLDKDNPVEYMGYLFDGLDAKMDSRLRAMMRDLKEEGYISTFWADNVPYYIEFNEKAYSFNEHNDTLTVGNGGSVIYNNYNITNGNANINSVDNSVRTINITNNEKELFNRMLEVASSIDGDKKNEIVSAITDMQNNYGKPTFKDRYIKFIEVAANHIALFSPFIPQITQIFNSTLTQMQM